MVNPGRPVRRLNSAYAQQSPLRAGAPRKRAVRSGPPPLSRKGARQGGVLIVVGAAVGIAGVFPAFTSAPPETNGWGEILLRVIPIVAWAAGGILVAIRADQPGSVRTGGLLALASIIVFTGYDVVEAGQLIGSKVNLEAGFWLYAAANVIGLVGAVIVVAALGRSRELGRPDGINPLPLLIAAVGCALAGVGYVPTWQRAHVVVPSAHISQNVPLNGEFDARWEVIIGQVIIMIGIVAVPLVASQWAKPRAGAAAIIGAVVGLGGFVAVTAVRVIDPLGQFPAATLKQLKASKVVYTAHFAAWFYVAIAGMAVLAVLALVTLVRQPADEDL